MGVLLLKRMHDEGDVHTFIRSLDRSPSFTSFLDSLLCHLVTLQSSSTERSAVFFDENVSCKAIKMIILFIFLPSISVYIRLQ